MENYIKYISINSIPDELVEDKKLLVQPEKVDDDKKPRKKGMKEIFHTKKIQKKSKSA